MFLLEIAIVSILIGLIRRGSLKNFFTGGLRVWFLFMISIILFIGLKAMCLAGVNVLGNYTFYVSIAAYVILFIALFFNLDGIWSYILLLGALLNFVMLVLNGGLMPVSQSAINLAGISSSYMNKFSYLMTVADDSTIFLWKYLGAIIPLPLPSILKEVLTPGTIIMAIGTFGMIQSVMTTEYMDESQYNQYMDELSSDDQKDSPVLDSTDDEEKLDYTSDTDDDEFEQLVSDSDDAAEDDLFAELRDDDYEDEYDDSEDDGLFDDLEDDDYEDEYEDEEEYPLEEDEYDDEYEEDDYEDLDPMEDFDEDFDPMEELEEDNEEDDEEAEEVPEDESIDDDFDIEGMLDDAYGFDYEPTKAEESDPEMATGSDLDNLIAETLGGTSSGYDEALLDELRNLGKEDEVENLTDEDTVIEDAEEPVETEEPDDEEKAVESENLTNIRNAQEMLKRVGSRLPKDEEIVETVPSVDTESPFVISNGRIIENPFYKFKRGKVRQDEVVDSPTISDNGLYVMSSGSLAKMNERNGKIQAVENENENQQRAPRRRRKAHMPNVTTTPGFDEKVSEPVQEQKTTVSQLLNNPYDNEKNKAVETKPVENKKISTDSSEENYLHTSRNNIIDEEGNEVPNPYEQVEMKIGDVEIKFWKKDNQ